MSDWHFGPETRAFLSGLRANNDKAWFDAHRAAYDRHWRDAGAACADVLSDGLARLTGRANRPKLFRIFNDVRFAKGKPPYKDHLHMIFADAEPAGLAPVLFFGLEPEGWFVGGGIPTFEAPALDRYRAAVDALGGAALAAILARARAEGATLWPAALKKPPRPFAPDHPRADLLRHKGLVLTRPMRDGAVAEAPGFVAAAMADFAAMLPFADWLRAA